ATADAPTQFCKQISSWQLRKPRAAGGGDLLARPRRVENLAIHHHGIARQMLVARHRLVDALKRHAERFVVFLLKERDEQMRRLGVENEIIEQGRLPRNEARQLPVRPHPDSVNLIGIVFRQTLEKVRLVIEVTMLEVNREWHGVKHVSAGLRKIVHHLEYVVLIQDVLRSAMVRDESVLARVLRGARVEIEVERNRVELRIEIDAAIIEAQRRIELQSGAFPV